MKILSMSATFGKLDGQTMTLQPGLNVIAAPNEWGKSTWCAFIAAMLYGIETSQRTSSKGLADKERYAPWSGKPMSGRMDILWNDRKITLERSSKGRSIFGVFRAYETDTGLPVPELTGENCGITLLGVEKTVFTRAGFVRQTEMPVSDDLALRRRLNELVTTGDESGASDKLAQKLKDLKNQCRHNKTGLLPQAEAQRDLLSQKLQQIETAKVQLEQIRQRQETLATQAEALENHKAWLAYNEARENMDRVAGAKADYEAALCQVRELERQAVQLPALEFAQAKLQQAQALQSDLAQLQTKTLPLLPDAPEAFRGLSPEDACRKAETDKETYDALQKPASPLLLILAAVCFLAGAGLWFVHPALITIGIVGAILLGLAHFKKVSANKQALETLSACYGTLPADKWEETAQRYSAQVEAYRQSSDAYTARKAQLQTELDALTGGKPLPEFMESHRQILHLWQSLDSARQDARQAGSHAEALAAMVKDLPVPQKEDTLTADARQTELLLNDCIRQQTDLQHKAGSFVGQIQTLGSTEDLTRQLQQVNVRIAKLEDTYAALTLAQQTLTEAANELQRRFAPKIAEKAAAVFARMTGGRYDRLVLGQDLSVSAGAQNEDTLHSAHWRSDGTVDQLYLSLRLAVAEALTPGTPLVLDDALVRFDKKRLERVMDILKEEADTRQVILFTCQEREQHYI